MMRTETEKKPNTRGFRFSQRTRIIAGALAVLMIISVLVIYPGNPFKKSAAANSDAAPEDSSAIEAPEATQGGAKPAQPETEATDMLAYWLDKADAAAQAKAYESAIAYYEKGEALAADDDQRAIILLQKGNIFFTLSDYAGAQSCFLKILELDQTQVPISAMYSFCAKCSLLLEDPKSAAESCALGLASLEENDAYEAELYMLRGTANVYMGQYGQASRDYSTAIEKGYPDKETLYQQISLCSYLQGDYSQTIQAGEQVSTGDTAIWKSMSYYAMGAYEKAAQAYESLLGSTQSYFTPAQLYSSIAKCRVLLGQYDEAIEKCTAGLQTGESGEAPTLYALRATSYMGKASYQEAVSDYLSAVEKGYTDPATLYAQCAACSYYLGDYENAVRFGITAQSALTEDTEAVLWVALSYYELEDYENAVPWLERSLSVEQSYCTPDELYRCLSRSQLILENYEEAAAEASDGIRSAEGGASGDMYAIRGAAYQSMGEYRKALQDFYAAIALGYADPYEMYKQCTLCNFLLGDFNQAISCGERALENKSQGDAALFYWLGVSYFSKENYEKGRETLKKAAALDDSLENIYFYIGICGFSLGEYHEASEYFTKSADRNENKYRSMYNRALCNLQLGSYTLAKQDLQAVAAQQEDEEIAADAAELLKNLATVF